MPKLTQKTIKINYNFDKTNQDSFFTLILYNKSVNKKVTGNPIVKYSSADGSRSGEWKSSVVDGEIYLFTKDFPEIKHSGTYYLTVYLDNGEIYPSSGHAQLTLENELPTDPSQIQVIKGMDGKSVSLDDVRLLVDEAIKNVDVVKGDKGDPGKTAYQLAIDNGFIGTEQEWLDSLKGHDGKDGPKGDKGDTGPRGAKGDPGETGKTGADGATGKDGQSAYQIAVNHGYVGNEQEWIEYLKGPKGDTGAPGAKGEPGDPGPRGDSGKNGSSAYQIAVSHGYEGSESSWLNSLHGLNGKNGAKGDPGEAGEDAYSIAVDNGFNGTIEEWLASLKGPQGDPGESITGPQGPQGLQGEPGPQGEPGIGEPGPQGDPGDSAYQIALNNGFTGTQQEWLNTLKGPKGDTGPQGQVGPTGLQGRPGTDGKDGSSAYQIAVANGFQGTEQDWLNSLHGGAKGDKGDKGDRGQDGKSAYQVAIEHGFTGSQEEWLASLKGEKGDKGDPGTKGDPGKSAYQTAKDNGFTGSQEEWLASLKGEKGDKGDKGDPGTKGDPGKSAYQTAKDNGFTGTQEEWLASLKGEKGDKGDSGEKGDKGDPGEKGAKGDPGESAYQTAKDNGFTGTQEEWLASLKGDKGDKGDPGESNVNTDLSFISDIKQNSADVTDTASGRTYYRAPDIIASSSKLSGDVINTNIPIYKDSAYDLSSNEDATGKWVSIPLNFVYDVYRSDKGINSYPKIKSRATITYWGYTKYKLKSTTINLNDSNSNDVYIDIRTIGENSFDPDLMSAYDKFLSVRKGEDSDLADYDTTSHGSNDINGLITSISYRTSDFESAPGNMHILRVTITVGWPYNVTDSNGPHIYNDALLLRGIYDSSYTATSWPSGNYIPLIAQLVIKI